MLKEGGCKNIECDNEGGCVIELEYVYVIKIVLNRDWDEACILLDTGDEGCIRLDI